MATKSGKKFAAHAGDWKYWHPTAVVKKLQELHRDGYRLVMFSNQKGISTERKDSKKRSGPGEKERSILGRFDEFLAQVLRARPRERESRGRSGGGPSR